MKNLIPLQREGVHWWMQADCRELFLGPDGFRLQEWLEKGRAVVVKKGLHRIVYRVELPGYAVYVKHNLIPDMRSWLRYLLRGSKARLEAQSALEVRRRGVPTYVPLAVGEKRSGPGFGESFLVTRSLDNTVPLDYFVVHDLPALSPTRQAHFRIELAEAMGSFLATIHNAGIMHHDLHCGNILMHLDNGGHPHLYLIDLQTVRLRASLTWAQCRANLIVLNRWLIHRTHRSDRLRFWNAYLKKRTECASDHPSRRFPKKAASIREACDLEWATRNSNESFWRRRERRYLEENRHVRPIHSSCGHGFAVADVDESFIAGLLRNPDEPFERRDVTWLKKSKSVAVVEFSAMLGGQSRQVVYKRFANADTKDSLAALVRWTPALRSWVYGHCLRERGLATARPLALLQRKNLGLVRQGYLLMEKLQTAGDLHDALSALASLEPVHRQNVLRMRIEQLARLIRELHSRRLAHRDLKATNILLLNEEDQPHDTELQTGTSPPSVGISSPFCFIDLVGVSRRRRVSRQCRVKNLARLHASFCQDARITRTDKLRFLREYLQWGLFGRQGWKSWWRAIEQATERKVAKNLRNGRELA